MRGHVGAAQPVVRALDRPSVCLPDRQLEREEIDLAQRLLVHDDVAVESMGLGLVADEVLDGGRYGRALHAAHIGAGDLAREEWIFRVVLEVAPSER